jgi:hypothetical protein
MERARRTAQVIVPVFMGGLRRADRMAIALELRGFRQVGGGASPRCRVARCRQKAHDRRAAGELRRNRVDLPRVSVDDRATDAAM